MYFYFHSTKKKSELQIYLCSIFMQDHIVEELLLPPIITKVTGQTKAIFGDGIIQLLDTVIGHEICEELFNPMSSHVGMSMQG